MKTEQDEYNSYGTQEDYSEEGQVPAFPKLFKGLIYACFIVGAVMLLFYCCK